MKLGIMQPYFFPYLGYFDCIHKTDLWIVFDIVQYTPKTWMNRNRILHPINGWQYISVPVKKFKRYSKIFEIALKDAEIAKNRIIGQLYHYKKTAPYFDGVFDVVESTFNERSSDRLVDLNVSGLKSVCRYLDIPINLDICSNMKLELPEINDPGHWALEISDIVGADTYINLPGGESIFNPEDYAKRSIQLVISELISFKYNCPGYDFVEHLSVLDVMMWNSPEKIKSYLDSIKG